MGLLAIDGEDDPRIKAYKDAQDFIPSPIGSYARVREVSAGKDSTIGHWEIAGIISDKAQPTYPDGFPEEVMHALEKATGKEFLNRLAEEGHDLVIIDKNVNRLTELANLCDCMGIIGNGASHGVLEEAGVASADLFISVTESDELNLLCCTIAKLS